jgi:hypothetical protein
MEKRHFSLEIKENSRFIKIFLIVFGILCVGIAIYWIIFNLSSEKSDANLWITVVFLTCFGCYQILSGLGKTSRYIETEPNKLVLKQNSFLPKIELNPFEIERIEVYPLSIRFCMIKKKVFIFRFGLNYTEIIDPIKEAVKEFAVVNNIIVEEKIEEI